MGGARSRRRRGDEIGEGTFLAIAAIAAVGRGESGRVPQSATAHCAVESSWQRPEPGFSTMREIEEWGPI